MKRLFIPVLACLCGCSTFGPRAGSRAHLDSIIIPHLALDNVSFYEAVDEIYKACAFYDPRRLQGKPHGFSFIVKSPIDSTTPVDPFADPEDPFVGSSSADVEYPTVTIHATDRSMNDILRDLCTQGGAEFSIIGKGTILIQQRRCGHPKN